MKVSVITVCLNAYNTLHRCLDSVKNQNYQEIEQIIVDGRSTDGTQKIIESYKKNINKIIIEKDKGIYDAMNKGLRNATGEIVCFLNSDDFYSSKNIISYVVQKFKEENIDVFAGDVAFFKKNNESKIIRKFSSSVFAPEKMKYGLMPAHPALFLRRELVNKIGFFKENYKIAGDFEFMLRIFKNINIEIEKNTHNIIVGPNGSGKSTLLGLLAGILYPESGKIYSYEETFGYIGPVPLIFSETLKYNLTYGNENETGNADNFIADSCVSSSIFAIYLHRRYWRIHQDNLDQSPVVLSVEWS